MGYGGGERRGGGGVGVTCLVAVAEILPLYRNVTQNREPTEPHCQVHDEFDCMDSLAINE